MSRTIRRGKPTKDLNFYYRNHIFDAENRVSVYDGEPYWKWKFEGTYEEYVEIERSNYHKDGNHYPGGIPWTWRNFESRSLRQKHRYECHIALRQIDEEVVLTPFKRDLGWWYW